VLRRRSSISRKARRIGFFAEQALRRRVDFGDLVEGAVEDEDGLAGQLKQQAIAGFSLAQPPVVALHRQLGGDQTLLQGDLWAQIARKSDAVPCRTGFRSCTRCQLYHRVGQGQIAAIRQGVIDMPPGCGLLRLPGLEQVLNLGLALDRHRLHPRLAAPGLAALGDQLVAAEGQVDDHALGIDQQHHIGRSAKQLGQGVGFEPGQHLGGFVQLPFAQDGLLCGHGAVFRPNQIMRSRLSCAPRAAGWPV
jgi:hypothetical protein